MARDANCVQELVLKRKSMRVNDLYKVAAKTPGRITNLG